MGGVPRRIGLLVSLLGFVLSVYCLLAGFEWMKEVPRQTSGLSFVALALWTAYLSLTFGIYFSYPQLMFPLTGFERFMKTGWILLAILSFFWPLISYLLSGNWAFDFSYGSALQGSEAAFWVFVYFSTILGLSLLLWPLLIVGNLLFRKAS